MNRLAAVACFALLFACVKEPELDTGSTSTPPIGGGGGGGAGSAGDAGTDGGTDAGQLVACNPSSLPTPCASGEYCACRIPAGTGSDCFCFRGEPGEPCAAGAAQCKAPGICRWSSGLLWGRCGSTTGACGEVCDLGSFFCDPACTCLTGCAWGRCCQ
ncbi:MAG: hypothetical protein ACYC8T_00535 [Myxococcaceae bacterium]